MNATDTDTEFLERLIEDECRCEASHGSHIPTCTVIATHRIVTGCGHQSNACQEVAKAYPRFVRPGTSCVLCGVDAVKCWTIRPI